MGDILTSVLVCGLLGLVGQGVRAVIGLNSSNVFGAGEPQKESEFDAAFLVISLIIGFIAGILAGLSLGVIPAGITPPDRSTLLGLIASGYAGTDFIEGAFSKLMPRSAGSAAAGARPAAVPAVPSPEPIGASGGAVQSLSSQVVAPAPPAASAAAAVSASPDLEGALRAVLPGLDSAVWLPALSGAFEKYNLSTALRMAAALGQFVAETGTAFGELREDMNYSASRLMQVFPNEIPDQATADRYAGDQEAIANLVYANRQGNGDVASGDGYRFRGGGLIQLTGRNEYTAFAAAVGLSLDQVTAYISTAEGAAVSGCWYLSTRGCLPLADQWRLTDMTEVVNGGALEGLATRIDYANRFRHVFGVPIPVAVQAVRAAATPAQDLRKLRAALRP